MNNMDDQEPIGIYLPGNAILISPTGRRIALVDLEEAMSDPTTRKLLLGDEADQDGN